MVKRLLTIWLSAAIQIVVMVGVLGYSSEDFSIGCFKEELNNRHFNVSAGNYIYEPNSSRDTPDDCVAACSALNNDYKLAGLTADDICLCSKVLAGSLQKANNNTSCLYKSNNGLFLKVFTIPSLANISVPESVMIFQEFLVNISTMPDPRCSYVLSFSDGRQVAITTNDTFVTHIYKSAGKFAVSLSSQSVCLPEVIMANIEVITLLGNVSLECPSLLEVTELNSHCKLRVLQGSNVTVSLNSTFLAEMSDPVVQSLGINPGEFYAGVRSSSPSHPAGTYLLPLDSAVDDGVLIAFEVYLSRTGNFKVQIFSPKCPANSLPCFSECVSPDVPCGGPSISSCSASQGMCLSLGQCNVTSSCESARSFYSPPQSNISFINYTVRFEFTTNITTTGYSFHRFSSPVPLQRGDVIGWYSSPSSADLEFQNSSSPFLLFYPNQEFSVDQLVSKSLNVNKLNRAYHFRPYIQTTSVLLIGVTPVVPRVHVNVNVLSGVLGRHEVLSRTVRVQERISGLHVVSPNISKTKYFPTKKYIFFALEVTNGSEVMFRFDAGDGSDPKNSTTGKFSHFYQQRGEYTFNVTAVNEINNVTIEETLTLLEDIRNLTFMRDPRDTPGETGIPYEVRFKFDAGDCVMFAVDFRENNTLFITCGNFTNQREFSVNYSYPAVGIYNITIHAYSKFLGTNLNITSSVEIMERISNLTLFQIKGNQDIPLKKELQNSLYSPLIIRVRAASGSSVTFQANASGSVNGGNVKNVSVHEAEFKFEFKISGIESITVSARNRISQVGETIRVIVVSQCRSWIDFYDKRNENDPLRTTRDTALRFSVEERQTGQDSGCNLSSCWEYRWRLFIKGGDGYKLKDHSNNTSKDTFFIPKSSLESGLYRLRVNSSCNDPRHFNRLTVSETYFVIERTQPVALILGGFRRDVAYDAKWTLILNASTSYDPDETYFSSKGLKFEWTCLSNRSLVFKKDSSVALVGMEQLIEGRNYTFEVRVNTSDQRSAVRKQLVILVDKDIPTTEIKCKINCLPFVVTTERLALEGYCQNCANISDIIFAWSLKVKEKGTWIPVNDLDTFTSWTMSNIVIKPKVLEQNKTYQLLLKAKRDKNAQQSTSVYIFKTSSAPRGGHCSIRPGSGISADTKFQVVCGGWQSRHYPLTYSIRYQSSFIENVNVSSVGENNHIWILWYHGQEQSSPRNILPAGAKSKDYYLDVNVWIQEKLGAFTTFNMSVKVGKARNVSTASFKKVLSELNNVDVENHPQTFTLLVTTYSTILNEDTARKDHPQNKQFRFDLMRQLSKVKAVTLPLIKQTTDAVKLVTYKALQVTHETQKVAADTLKKMSGTLIEFATDPTRRDGQVIDETARNLFSGLSKLLDASFFTGDDIRKKDAAEKVKLNLYGTTSKKGAELKKIGEETQDVVSNVVSIIQDISLAILKKKLIGEEPTVTQTDNFDMKLDYTLTQDVDKVTKVSNASGQFRLPHEDETLFSKGNYSRIYTEFVAFKNNPFSWDIDRSPFIQPRVLSLSFKTEQNISVPIHNLTKNIEIFLLNEKQNINQFILEASKLDPYFLAHNFRVTQSMYTETLLLDIQVTNGGSLWMSGARFFIRFGGQVSQSNFDFSHQFSDCTSCEGHSINIKGTTVLIHEFKKLKLSGGRVSIGVLPCARSGICAWSFNSTVERFMVYLTSVSCRFWDKSQWKTDGCSVGPSTTPWQTHCLCNHLTSFGSYIVKPNPLTKFSLEDFKQGYIVFVAVVTIFLLYLLVLVWARKADRADITKGRVCFLSDNNREDRHRYEIAIWTGMRRNAGTESKVTVILSGDLHDSEPRHLVNPITQQYQRGSLEKFLLTTPEDLGSLYCIRIWHDNSKGSWYLSRVMVTDLESDERFYFICDRWLAVDEDDGAVERLLPVASDEELTEFQRLFFSRTKRNLSDSHLWLSVLNRPPQSPFTRVQRLSSCLCLLMITMVTNAMFYNTKSEPKPNSTNFIGSYSFTWDEVFIGVVSSLIIFPANILILYIFRHVRPKPSKTRRSKSFALGRLSPDYRDICMSVTSSVMTTETTVWGPGEDKQVNSVPDPVMKKKKKKKKKVDEVTFRSKFKKFLPRLPSSLPHCFVYFAWIILVVLTLGSATVLILYGMEFGNGRSLQWLFSILVSICEDIFVLQPLKVLIVALIFALLVKKPDDGEFRISAADNDSSYDDHELLLTSPDRGDSEEEPREKSPRLVVRPDEGQLKMMRKARVKDRKIFGLIQEIIVHILFSIVILLVTYGHKDSRAIYLFRQLDELSTNAEKVFIGVVSSLIIFPANILILYIFRHVRPKPSKTRRSKSFALGRLSPDYRDICMSVTSSVMTTETTVWGPGEDKQVNSVPDPVMKKKKKKKKKVDEVTFRSKFKKFLPRLPSSLPHCFVYFAWIILVVLTLGSATVLILYGMEFGNGRSLQWLFSILVSICEDIFVLQPLKVLIVALIFALLVKKPDDGEFRISAADNDSSYDDHELLLTSPDRGDSEEEPREKSPRLVVRPDEGQLKMMRKARVKDRKIFGLIQEIIVHILFSIVILLVTYGHKDSRAIYLFRQLDELSTNAEKIGNFTVFWNWTKTVLIPKAFPEELYNKEDVSSYGFFDDQYNFLISRARFRLLRVKGDSCNIPDELKQAIHFCAKDYSIYDQDEAFYGEGWTETEEDVTSPWSFQTWRNLDGYPYWGRFETYSGGGYVTELIPGENNNETANKMEKSHWVERYSRALFVEFTIYNANVNLFSSILLLFEFPSFGGVFFRRDIRPMRLKVYVGGFAFFIFACEVVFLIFIAGYLYLALKKIYRNGVGYFKQFWNLIDFAIVAVSLAAIGVYIYRIDMIINLMQRVRELDGKFVNFQYATYWSEVFDCVVAIVVCLTTIKLTKLMRFNMRISLFALTLKRARPALLAFSLQFGLVFFAYVIVGVLVFGHNAAQFKSISSTILSLGCQILGKNQFTELSEIDPIVGSAFFVTYVLFVCWILASMFIAILLDSYHQVLLDADNMTNDYEIMEFFLVRFRAWSGLGSGNKRHVTPTARWQRARTKIKAANTFGRHRRVYQPSAENVALQKTADLMERLETSIATLENRIGVLESLDGMRHKRMSRVSWAMREDGIIE